MMSHVVIIALGSNILPAAHMQWALGSISLLLDNIRVSRWLWTEDIKGTGRMYMNGLVSGITALSAEELSQKLKDLEAATGRTKGRVTLDLDLMRYDNRRYHLNDWPRPYIQQLLPDLQ